jgi:hypothetical protein
MSVESTNSQDSKHRCPSGKKMPSLPVMIQGQGEKVYRLAVPMLQRPDINTTTLSKNATHRAHRGEERTSLIRASPILAMSPLPQSGCHKTYTPKGTKGRASLDFQKPGR